MYKNTLYQKLADHQKKGYSSFHTPGHKCTGFFPPGLTELDLTELPDTDALYECEGVILEAERKLARLFRAGRTMISAGGCTLAIQAMLRIASMRGRRILFARNIHRSAVNACALLGIEPVWVLPRSDTPLFTGRVAPEDVEAAFCAHNDITACYITSPDYYGELADIRSIAQICHSRGALLLVDNAHGSHLAFMKNNIHPIALGADMTACSMHKTLPVLTGGAVLNFADSMLSEYGKQAMALFGSTSPSYPIMASVDLCRSWLENGGSEKYAALEDRTGQIKGLARSLGLSMPEGLCDPLRVCVNTSLCGVSGQEQIRFFHGHLIEPEFCDGSNAVFICTPFNSEEDMRRLESAVKALAGMKRQAYRRTAAYPSAANTAEIMTAACLTVQATAESGIPESFSRENAAASPSVKLRSKAAGSVCMGVLPEKMTEPREALLSSSEAIPTEKAVGRISADSACPCPPGIPIVMPGELIDERVCEALAEAEIGSVRVVC